MFGLYAWFKFVHVAAAILWIGSGVTMSVINWRLGRMADPAAVALFSRVSLALGRFLTGPAMALTLLAGIATTLSGGLSFGLTWISWGFGGVLLSIILNVAFIRRTAGKLESLAGTAQAGDGQLASLQQRLALLNWVNILVLFSTVWAMVAKPML